MLVTLWRRERKHEQMRVRLKMKAQTEGDINKTLVYVNVVKINDQGNTL